MFQASVESVRRRIEDVRDMCEKRRGSLKRLAAKGPRPVQPVSPEPQLTSPPPSGPGPGRRRKSLPVVSPAQQQKHERSNSGNRVLHRTKTEANGSERRTSGEFDPRTNESEAVMRDSDLLAAKRGHVMRELIDTERVYVQEMRTILEGYCDEMDSPYMQQFIPPVLRGKQDVLFGNLREIADFHAK